MVERRQPKFLRESADNCVERLQQLKQHADDRRLSNRTLSRSRRELLSGVLQDVNDSLRTLQAWIAEFSKGDQTDNPEVIAKAEELFESLFQSITEAHRALNSRLRHRRLSLHVFIRHERLRSLLSYCPASDMWLENDSSISSAIPCKM